MLCNLRCMKVRLRLPCLLNIINGTAAQTSFKMAKVTYNSLFSDWHIEAFPAEWLQITSLRNIHMFYPNNVGVFLPFGQPYDHLYQNTIGFSKNQDRESSSFCLYCPKMSTLSFSCLLFSMLPFLKSPSWRKIDI